MNQTLKGIRRRGGAKLLKRISNKSEKGKK